MVNTIRIVGLAVVLITGLSACGGGPTAFGPWWVEMTLDCGGSTIYTAIPFNVTEDKTLAGGGDVQGMVKLPYPLVCPEFREVNVAGTVDLAGSYTNSGGGGFVFDQVNFLVSPEYNPNLVCPGKPLDIIDQAIPIMDVAQFFTSFEQGWEKRINFAHLGEPNQENKPDIVAQDGATGVLQAGFCNVNILLHQEKMSIALASTSTEAVSISPPTATLDISYTEIAQQLGYKHIQVNQPVGGGAFSLWVPEPYEDTRGRWVTGEFLEIVSQAIDDYAYDIFADHPPLFTASDTTFYYGSPHANQCEELQNNVTVGHVEFAVRTGQDLQLADMPLSNYAGLLTLAFQGMRGDEWHYPQESESFQGAGYEAWRIISDYAPRDIYFQLSNFQGRGYDIVLIDYILKEGDRIWVFSFSTAPEFYFEESACAYLADDFDLIVRTFEALP